MSSFKRLEMMEAAGITSEDLDRYFDFVMKDSPEPDYDATRKVINQIKAWKKKQGIH